MSASEPPRTLPPSIPPSTDDIDTDWGAEAAEAAPAPVATVPSAPPPPAPAPVEAAPAPAPVEAAPVRQAPRRSQTLIGMSPPVVAPRASVPPSAPPPAVAESAPPAPVPAAEGARAQSFHPNPLRSRTLIGLPQPTAPKTEVHEPESEPTPDDAPPGMVAASSYAPTPPPGAVVEEAPEPVPSRPPIGSARPPAPPPRVFTEPPAASTAAPSAASVPSSAAPSSEPDPEFRGTGRRLLWVAAAVVLLSAAGFHFLRTDDSAAHGPSLPPAPVAVAVAPTATPEPVAAPQPTPTTEPTPAASAAASAVAAAPSASAAEAPAAPSSAAAPATSAEPSAPTASGDVIKVLVKSVPPKARFYHYGKEIGTAPFVLELKPGERHAYEAGLPGYGARKVVIDGSKPEISVGLRKSP